MKKGLILTIRFIVSVIVFFISINITSGNNGSRSTGSTWGYSNGSGFSSGSGSFSGGGHK